MGLLTEHLTRGQLAATMVVLLLGVGAVWIWRNARLLAEWERGLIPPRLLVRVREAILIHRRATGSWPEGKNEIYGRVAAAVAHLETRPEWDCKLLRVSRDEKQARYSILVGGSWREWQAVVDPSAQAHASPVRRGKTRPDG